MDAPVVVELSAMRKAAVLQDEGTAFYSSASWHSRSVATETTSHNAHGVRAVVETFFFSTGQTPRALLGGKFRPGPGARLTAEAGTSRDPWNAPKTCASRLWLPFRVGLPDEYVDAVLDGLADPELPPGTVTVDRAGHDEANSSSRAFYDAARLLGLVLQTQMRGGDVEAGVRGALAEWA
ncbi:MAG: hypothetical protein QM714_12975 [Nocardioides sp.]|uniref:hypothetical protein n=1 Tax=Nocardioides sp. TaxID=35761 RepID=UPI0039E62504